MCLLCIGRKLRKKITPALYPSSKGIDSGAIISTCSNDDAHGAVGPLVGTGQQTSSRIIHQGTNLNIYEGTNLNIY